MMTSNNMATATTIPAPEPTFSDVDELELEQATEQAYNAGRESLARLKAPKLPSKLGLYSFLLAV